MWYFFIWRYTYNILDIVMTSYSTRKKLTFTLTAHPVTVTWTQSWAFSVICTYTIVQTWITVAWIHWNNIILFTNSFFLAPSITSIMCSIGNYQEGLWICLTLFNLTTFQCLTQVRTWISDVICRDLFSVQWFEVRYCSFCWYLWSCWLSFFIRVTRWVPLVEQKDLLTLPEHLSIFPV